MMCGHGSQMRLPLVGWSRVQLSGSGQPCVIMRVSYLGLQGRRPKEVTGDCLSCLVAASCLDNPAHGVKGRECEDLGTTGLSGSSASFTNGSGVTGSTVTACENTLACMVGSTGQQCAANAQGDTFCYCGTGGFNGGGPTSCSARGADVNGACLAPEVAGFTFAQTDANDIVDNYTDTTGANPSGIANQLLNCEAGNNCLTCLGATPKNVIFSDDFTGSTLSANWTALSRHGDYGNDELQCYVPAAVSLSGGGLAIESQAATQTCGDSTHAPSTWAYTSGMVQWTRFSFTYGTVEFKAKMPGGQGTWPAIWLLGANCQASNVLTADNVGTCDWPNPGSEEIDITEIVNSDHVHVNQALHSGATNTNCTATTTDVTQNVHVYRLVWTAGSLVWTIDGAETCTFSSGVPSTPMFVVLDTALGGVGGPVSSSSLPQTMNVDYITVTQP